MQRHTHTHTHTHLHTRTYTYTQRCPDVGKRVSPSSARKHVTLQRCSERLPALVTITNMGRKGVDQRSRPISETLPPVLIPDARQMKLIAGPRGTRVHLTVTHKQRCQSLWLR